MFHGMRAVADLSKFAVSYRSGLYGLWPREVYGEGTFRVWNHKVFSSQFSMKLTTLTSLELPLDGSGDLVRNTVRALWLLKWGELRYEISAMLLNVE
jgi:hypothetical protein